jgi:hypothetical protein
MVAPRSSARQTLRRSFPTVVALVTPSLTTKVGHATHAVLRKVRSVSLTAVALGGTIADASTSLGEASARI